MEALFKPDGINGEHRTKKKVFFILSSLTSGGSERVFWNMAQALDKRKFEVAIVLLSSKANCYSSQLDQVRFIDLNTLKASRSFFKLYALLNREKPYAVFSTTDHINILVAFVAKFLAIPRLIARASNIPEEQILHENLKSKFYMRFTRLSYGVYQQIICQTEEMKQSLVSYYGIDSRKMLVIPNPVVKTAAQRQTLSAKNKYHLIVVARFSPEKGLDRLVDILSALPAHYHLSFVGIGLLRKQIERKVKSLRLVDRVTFYGEIKNVLQVLTKHELMVLSSHTEGFPNVILEALSVGLPVVTFKVSGVTGLIKNGFNGYVLPQNDIEGFKEKIIQACTQTEWDPAKIKQDVYQKYALQEISKAYEKLLD